MDELNHRERALLAYFHAIATDPRVMAAGKSLSGSALKKAVLDCMAEDFPGVGRHVLGRAVGKVESPVRRATHGVSRTVVGGAVSPEAEAQIVGTIDVLVSDGFRAIKDWMRKKPKPRR